MEPTQYTSYLQLSFLLIAWCILHSVMITKPVTEYIKQRLGGRFRFYRLFYNLMAIVTLVPIALFAHSLQTQALFSWSGFLRIGQLLLSGSSLLLFILGIRHYDARQFLGIRQFYGEKTEMGITSSGELDTTGILNVVRHPWYLSGILLVWSRDLDVSAIVVNVILSCYLIVGACLEEKKLIREFGEQYLSYQKRVSMLIPYKWLKAKMIT